MSFRNSRLFSLNHNHIPIKPIWCIVADVAEATLWDQHGNIKQRGTRHFNGGETVYCSPSIWGQGNASVKAIGLDRRTGRPIAVIMSAQYLTNWRVAQVDDPDVLDEFSNQWDDTDQSHRRAEELVEQLRRTPACPML